MLGGGDAFVDRQPAALAGVDRGDEVLGGEGGEAAGLGARQSVGVGGGLDFLHGAVGDVVCAQHGLDARLGFLDGGGDRHRLVGQPPQAVGECADLSGQFAHVGRQVDPLPGVVHRAGGAGDRAAPVLDALRGAHQAAAEAVVEVQRDAGLDVRHLLAAERLVQDARQRLAHHADADAADGQRGVDMGLGGRHRHGGDVDACHVEHQRPLLGERVYSLCEATSALSPKKGISF